MAKTKYNLHLKGYVGGWDFDSDYVDFVLNKNTDKEVAVLIDSLGGQLIDVYLGNPMRHDEKYLLINQGFAGSNASCRTSSTKTTMTLSSPSSQQEWSEDATASARTSLWRSSQNPKKTFSNTVQTAPMPSTRSTSAAKNSRSMIYIQLRLVG